MKFKDIIGQKTAKKLVWEMFSHDRIPHAILISANEGAGGLAFGLALSQMLQCIQPTSDGACENCSACHKASQYIHPDIHYSYPTIKKGTSGGVSTDYLKEWRATLKQNHYFSYQEWLQNIEAENKQGNIYKEECVAILQKLSFKILEGKYKILVQWLPENLGNEGNRLLKIIEEPPTDTYFILITENIESILNTIISRCQVIKLNPLSDDEVANGLIEYAKIGLEEAKSIAFLADGNLGEALEMTKKSKSDNATLFLEWLRKCYTGNASELVEWVEKFSQTGRENQKFFLQYALHFLRELLILILTKDPIKVRLKDIELSTAQNLEKIITPNHINLMAQLFDDSILHIERNANPKILFLDISIQLNKILRNKNDK